MDVLIKRYEELLKRQAQITINNIKNIVKLVIQNSKNANIYVCLLSIPEDVILSNIFQETNNKIKQISNENGINIYNMSFFSSINRLFIEKCMK